MTLGEQWDYFQDALFEWSERHDKGILIGCMVGMVLLLVIRALIENGIL